MSASVLQVSLSRRPHSAPAPAAFATPGARVVLGQGSEETILGEMAPISPSAATLFGPRGACVTNDGALWVADTGHHRLLGWDTMPMRDGAAADRLIGQPEFSAEGRNAHREVDALTLNVPTGLCACGDGLALADAWNHRVLIWRRAPRASHVAPDLVLGQADCTGAAINRGTDTPDADTLYWPYGVHWDGTHLWIADTGNRRVLCWHGMPERNGQPADLVLGQPDFRHRDENAGEIDAASLRWPHALAFWRGRLCVADAGNNRVLIWAKLPSRNHAPADRMLGQRDAVSVDHNRGEYWPTARSFNMPYGLAVHRERLLVADTANSRVLRFDVADADVAAAVAGQAGFADKGDNRWQVVRRDSLCWPYALTVSGDTCLIADSGNNRVLLWEVAP
jgi:sugar lactone lactonase YvrE